jgi:hypothetical protein
MSIINLQLRKGVPAESAETNVVGTLRAFVVFADVRKLANIV